MNMITFNLNDKRDGLLIDINIPDTPLYNNVVIRSLAIQNHKQYTIEYPDSPKWEESFTIHDNITTFSKTILLEDLNSLGISSTGFYFLYVVLDVRTGDSPEGMSMLHILPALDFSPLYNLTLKLLKKFLINCSENRMELADLYLQKQTILQALEMKDYILAIDLFDYTLKNNIQKGKCLDACGSNKVFYNSHNISSC